MYDIEISEDIFERYYGNLTQYIPDFLIEIKEISSVYRAQSRELARFNLEIQDVLNQFNIDTATWGLILHEIKYGIEFNPSLSLEERRHRIKGAKRGRGTSDTYMLKNTAEAFGKCEAYIDRHDSDYYFNLLLSSYNGFSKSFDYLYKIEKNKWYGWPDFSGGDPIDSPRFKVDKPITKIIENHPNKIVQGPLFQFDELGSIKYLSIDTEGAIFEKDTGVYYDEGKNMISSITKDSVVNRLLKLKDDSIVKEIKIKDNSVYILDSGIGCIYKLSSNDENNIFNLPRSVLIFIMVLLGILVFIFMYKYNSKNN